MTVRSLMFLMLMLCMGMLFAAFAGVIAFGIARWGGTPVPEAINRGSFVFFSTMSLIVALLGVLLPVVT